MVGKARRPRNRWSFRESKLLASAGGKTGFFGGLMLSLPW